MATAAVTGAGTETLTTAPTGSWVTVARVFHGLIALIGTASFLVSCWLSATGEENGGALNGIIFTLSYFTVWSNIFAFIVNWAPRILSGMAARSAGCGSQAS